MKHFDFLLFRIVWRNTWRLGCHTEQGLVLGWVCWLTYGTYVALVTPVWAVTAKSLCNPRLTHTELSHCNHFPITRYKALAACFPDLQYQSSCIWAVAVFIWVSIHLHASARARVSTHISPTTFRETVLSILDCSPAPGPDAACCDMKSDIVNLPPNPSDRGLDSEGSAVGLGDSEQRPRQLLTTTHPHPYPHKIPQQWNCLKSTTKCSHSRTQCHIFLSTGIAGAQSPFY